MTQPKRVIRTKIPNLTPKQLRLVLLKEEQKKKREELRVIREQIEPVRKAVIKKEAAIRKLEEKITGDYVSTSRQSNIVTEEEIEALPAEVRDDIITEDVNVVFRPNKGPQTEFLAATEKEVFYGGARGGGKSYSLLVDPLRYCNKADARALILRRTMPELRDLINHSHRLYDKAFPGAKWREQEKEWRFPSGARIEFGYAETPQDALRYQGQAYTWIGVDELPQFPTPEVWTLLKGSLRSVDPTIPTFMRATGNPGNIGSIWVKEMFIDPAPAGVAFHVDIDPGNPNSEKISRKFIQAKLKDNPYLTQTSEYKNMLLSLHDIKRKQWLDGDWSAFEGAAFSEFDPQVHVIEPFDIPSNWPKFRACDWGFSSPFCVLWIACDYDNILYVYREFYGKGLTADIFAQRVKDLEFGEQVQYGVMDSSVWSRRGDIGPPVPEIMRNHGCVWRPSDRSPGSRHSNKMEVHRRLRVFKDENGNSTAKLKIFKNCRNLIRTLPMLPLDDNDLEDVNTRAEDHAYDALRYGIASRPIDPVKVDYYQQLDRQQGWRPASRVGY